MDLGPETKEEKKGKELSRGALAGPEMLSLSSLSLVICLFAWIAFESSFSQVLVIRVSVIFLGFCCILLKIESFFLFSGSVCFDSFAHLLLPSFSVGLNSV